MVHPECISKTTTYFETCSLTTATVIRRKWNWVVLSRMVLPLNRAWVKSWVYLTSVGNTIVLSGREVDGRSKWWSADLMLYSTTALRKHFAPFVYRLGHCPFTAVRRGSIPPRSTIFNYIGLPKPVGHLGIGCLDGDGCAKCHERWKRNRKVDTVVTLENVGS